jgi:diguanylate cyclase (GGDEF)-like protein
LNWRTAKQLTYATFTILYGWMVLAFVARLMMPGVPGIEQFFERFKPIIAVLIGFQGLLSAPFVWLCKAVTQFLPDLAVFLPFTTPDKLYGSLLFLFRLIPYFHGVGGMGALDKVAFATVLPGYIDWTIPMVIVFLTKIESIFHCQLEVLINVNDREQLKNDRETMRQAIIKEGFSNRLNATIDSASLGSNSDPIEEVSFISKRPKRAAELIPVVQDLREEVKSLEEKMYKDALTGLYTKQYFMETLERSFSMSIQKNGHLGLLFIDLDDFKKLNDHYGHEFGDLVLKQVGIALTSVKPSAGFSEACRYGGEELVSVLTGCDTETAKAYAVNVLHAVRNLSFTEAPDVKVTASIGLFNVHFMGANGSHNLTVKQLIEYADQQAYKSKQNGKNRISLGVIE